MQVLDDKLDKAVAAGILTPAQAMCVSACVHFHEGSELPKELQGSFEELMEELNAD